MRHTRTPVGVTDDLPDACARKEAVWRRLAELFAGYGYGRISCPTLEYAEVFTRAGAEASACHTLADRDGALLALRPDMTPAIARAAATAYTPADWPLRFCYRENLFRQTGAFRGQVREFAQAGIELIGAAGADADAEAVALGVKALAAAGLADFRVYVSHASLFEALMARAGFDEGAARGLRARVAARDFVTYTRVVSEQPMDAGLKAFLLDLPFQTGGAEVLDAAARFTDTAALVALYELLDAHQVAGRIGVDLGMVGQWGYYTGVIFRGYAGGAGAAALAGGRYDKLAGLFGADCPSVGFGVLMEPLLEALAAQNAPAPDKPPVTLLAYQPEDCRAALAAAEALRRDGAVVVHAPGGLGLDEAVTYAQSRGMAGVLYFGGGMATAADIAAGTRKTAPIASLGGGV